MEKTKENAKAWIEAGKPCIYRYGWAYKGASAKRISTEEALDLLPKYSFGIGFYELGWRMHEGEEVLEFNELGENDMY